MRQGLLVDLSLVGREDLHSKIKRKEEARRILHEELQEKVERVASPEEKVCLSQHREITQTKLCYRDFVHDFRLWNEMWETRCTISSAIFVHQRYVRQKFVRVAGMEVRYSIWEGGAINSNL
jgi:hypothetical protein